LGLNLHVRAFGFGERTVSLTPKSPAKSETMAFLKSLGLEDPVMVFDLPSACVSPSFMASAEIA
jgi:hypothetical protein